MAQIQKFQDGSGAGGIQPSKLKFKINGVDYEKDEQFVKDQFEPMFKELVSSGEARERDRDMWKGSFQDYLKQARTGLYELESSSGKLLSNKFSAAEGTTPELGLNEEGTTARKTQLGEIISPRKKQANQRMAFINGMLGNRLVGAYEGDTLAAKNKADADAAKLKADRRTAVLDKLKPFATGFGNVTYGQDFATTPDLVQEKWWDKSMSDANRIASMSSYYQNQLGSVFNTELDEYKDDADFKARFNGRSLDEVRDAARKVYDPTANKFITPAKTLKDFSTYANVLDTMGSDNLFQDKSAWEKARQAQINSTKSPEQIALDQATAEANAIKAKAEADRIAGLPTAAGKLFKGKDNKYYTDKDGTKLADGLIDGTLYGAGNLWDGHYVGRDSSGEEDYYGNLTGTYVGGKMVTKDAYENWYRSLESKRAFDGYRRDVLDQRRQKADYTYNSKFGGEGSYQTRETIQDKDGSDFILADVKENYTHAQNITANYSGLKDTAVALIRDANEKDRRGMPMHYNVVRTKDSSGKLRTFVGKLKTDAASGNTIFIGKDGRENKEVSAKFKGSKFEPIKDNPGAKYFRLNQHGKSVSDLSTPLRVYNAIATTPINAAANASKVLFKQQGGNIQGIEQSSSTQKRHQQSKVKDLLDATSSNYNLSSTDRWELGALAGDLGAVIASMTGAGSVVAGGLGVASTATQFGVDIARDGLDWGDAGRLGMGLALDAASFVPGLGLGSSSYKTVRTLGKAAKWLVPALSGMGVLGAAGTITDIVSGKKKITDLNIDDLRSLVNGIHGVMGVKRGVRNIAATTSTNQSYVTLKGGKRVPIAETDVAAINAAEDKVKAAKEAVARSMKLVNTSGIELPSTSSINAKFWKGGLRTSTPDSKVDVSTETNGVKIRSLDDYQGDNFSDRFMRNSINRTLQRNPTLRKAYEAEHDVHVTGKQFGLLGDNTRKSTITPLIPKDRRLEAPSGKPLIGNHPDRIQQTATPTPRKEVTDISNPTQLVADKKASDLSNRMSKVREAKAIKAVERQAIREKEQVAEATILKGKQDEAKKRTAEVGKQLSMFTPTGRAPKTNKPQLKQDGGIIKAQLGVKVKPRFDITEFLPTANYVKYSSPNTLYGPLAGLKTSIEPEPLVVPKFSIRGQVAPSPSRELGGPSDTGVAFAGNRGRGLFSKVGDVLKNVNPVTASELSRALWTRRQNSMIDTRVERPMVDAPTEISTPVRGNLLLKNSFDTQANNIVRSASQLPTNDASLMTAAGLEANRNAGILRAQGEVANAEYVDRTRNAAIENDMRNASARSAAANQNVQTNARATQAERGAQNEKLARMNQPIADFWKDTNYKAMVKEQQSKGIDTQIALQGKQGNFNLQMQPLQAKYSANQQRMSSGQLTQPEIDALQAENALIEKQVNWLTNQGTLDQLQTRKDLKYVTPTDWYTKGLPTMKEGGAVKVAIQNQKEAGANSRAIAKQHTNYINEGLEDDSKKSMQTMKNIQELIKLALG